MNKFYKLKQAIFPVILLAGSCAFAQVQLNQLTEFGTPVKDINNSGKGLHANGYYDFSTNSSSVTEEGVGETVSITNSGMVLGKIADESGENYIPAMRVDGTWSPLANMDETLGYTLYAISENGVYVVGQTDWTVETGSWGFIYNTQTQTLTILDSPLYEYGAAYGVNNEGIAVGWVDDLPSGTVRMPAYFTEDGTITLIKDTHGEASNINDNNEIVGNFGGAPFIYKIASDEFTSYEIPADYLSAAFADISDNGIAVGYAETFIEGQGPLRMPIIFHPNLGAQPIFLNDFLNEHDIDTSTLDGIVYKISSDGNYLGGWSSGPAVFALGWAVYLDDQIILEPVDYCDVALNCTDGDLITNVTFAGIDNDSTCSPDGYGDYTNIVAEVNAGETYPISVTVGDGWYERVSLWIDFGNDGSFDAEDFLGEIGDGGQGVTLEDEIAIPADVAVGEYRMRILVYAAGSEEPASEDPCLNDLTLYGEYEDYTVNVGVMGVSDLNNSDLTLYPNPVKDILNFNSKKQIQNISAYNVAGQQVINNAKTLNGKLNVASLAPGVYVFKITLEGGKTETFKIIKK